MSETEKGKQTVVESGTEVEGVVRSKCAIVVSGQVSGEVSAPSLSVTSEGAVHGKVKVSQLKSQGSLAGEIDAESVELSGRISDDTVIRAAKLEVKLNQSEGNKLKVTFGNCELQVGQPAAKSKQEATGNGHKKEQPSPAVTTS